MPIEIKYQQNVDSRDLKPVMEFMKKFHIKKGMVVTKNDEKEVKTEEGIIKLIPAWKWFLEKEKE